MGDLDVLKKIRDNGYREPAPDINKEEFFKVIDSRRSVRVFTDDPIPDDVVESCLQAGLDAPNSSNLQPWEFYWIKSPDKLELIKKYCLGQSAATTAQTIIIAVAKWDNWDLNRKRMISFFNEQTEKPSKGAYLYYEKVAKQAYSLGPINTLGLIKRIFIASQRLMGKVTPQPMMSVGDLRVWAQKTTALACENIMLAFRAHGFDTCPMEGLDPEKIHKMLGLSKGSEVCMAIGAGKRAPHGIFSPRVRFDKEFFVKKI